MSTNDDDSGGRIGRHLVKSEAIEESRLTAFLSERYGLPVLNLEKLTPAPEVLKLVPRTLCLEHRVIPVNRAGAALIVAMSDPSDTIAVDTLATFTGCMIEIVVASESAIRAAIDRYYPS